MRIPRKAARGKTPSAGSLECDCAPINRPLVRRTGYRGRHRRIRRDCGGLGQDGPCADRLAPSRRFAARRKVAASLAPEGCRKSHGEYRHLVLRRFPFGVFDLFDGKTISVIGGLNLRQDPATIRAILKSEARAGVGEYRTNGGGGAVSAKNRISSGVLGYCPLRPTSFERWTFW